MNGDDAIPKTLVTLRTTAREGTGFSTVQNTSSREDSHSRIGNLDPPLLELDHLVLSRIHPTPPNTLDNLGLPRTLSAPPKRLLQEDFDIAQRDERREEIEDLDRVDGGSVR